MAINAYTGLMGSGKSYEAVRSTIIPAIANGRRVVTNIDGVNGDRIRAYCAETMKKDPESMGVVVHVSNDDVLRPDFFPSEDGSNQSTVLPGDVVVIDEAWRFWPNGVQIEKEHMTFFRMHRHYTHPETGVACDVVLILQNIGDLHRSVKAVVELTAVTTKLKTLGLNKSYRIQLYEGGRTTKSSLFDTRVQNYDKRIFPLYASYAAAGGNEKAIDSRQNILKNPRIIAVGLGALAMLGVSGFFILSFFDKPDESPSEPVAGNPALPVSEVVQASNDAPPITTSAEYRIAGEASIQGVPYVVLLDRDGSFRFEPVSASVGLGALRVIDVGPSRARALTVFPTATTQSETPL
jgi:zona occludens toxin